MEQSAEFGADQTRQKVFADIQRFGFSIMDVEGRPSLAYTIGLAPANPELLIVGLDPSLMPVLLQDIVRKQREGQITVASGEKAEGIVEGGACYFGQVDRDQYEKYVGVALRWHSSRDFPLLQVVFPDQVGRFPWQPGYETAGDQPVLFRPEKE